MVLTLMPEMIARADGIDPMLPRPCRVQRVRRETYDTFTLELEPEPHPHPLSESERGAEGGVRFAPGQFNMLYRFGVGEVPISISGDPVHRKTIVHTVRAVGPATRAICKMKRGEVLGVRGPFGRPWPVEESAGNDIVIVAGGIGLAPLRPAIYHLLANREHYGRNAALWSTYTS